MVAERAPPGAWRFDRVTLDLARGALLADSGAEVALRLKSFALLRLLVENASPAVSASVCKQKVSPGNAGLPWLRPQARAGGKRGVPVRVSVHTGTKRKVGKDNAGNSTKESKTCNRFDRCS
jgi:hypothetical protein